MVPASSSPADRPIAGISLCVFGLFLFSLQDVIIKSFSGTYSVLQIVFVRSMVAMVPIIIAVLLTSGWRGMRAYKPRVLLLRGFLGFLSYLAYYMAIAALPLVDVVTIVFSAPILVTVLSATLLKEPVGARRWSAVFLGFLAIVIVVGPSGDVGHLAALLALLAAFAYACSILITRLIGPNDRPWTITLYSMLAFLIGSSIASVLVVTFSGAFATENLALQFLLRPWVVPAIEDCLLMVFLGLNAAVGFYCLIKAYWVSPVSVVAPFEYTYIIWAVLFGYVIWSEIPRVTSIFGVALLIACSFYIFRTELQLRREMSHEWIPGQTIVGDEASTGFSGNELIPTEVRSG
ncbi:MAG: DMT family transporter [Gammaproteobacteria bacterium]|nr:DMT family transporter [Gammaproteobacteria bacterium]